MATTSNLPSGIFLCSLKNNIQKDHFFFTFYQKTALHWAAEGGHKDTVEYLVDKGASVDIKDHNGVSKCY